MKGIRVKTDQYRSMDSSFRFPRRRFLFSGVAGVGLLLGTPDLWAREQQNSRGGTAVKTNIDEFLKVPKGDLSLPGTHPGKVVQIRNQAATSGQKINMQVVREMFRTGIRQLTGKNLRDSFRLWFRPDDIVGIKVNPVGAGLISTRVELVEAIIEWLEENGLARNRIVIWDRFDYMLAEAGFTPERFPGVQIEGLQTMDEAAALGKAKDDSRWLRPDGTHISADHFDKDVYYWADVEAPKDKAYLNQHVFNGKYSYFGKLVTRKLTKIINVPVFKNTGNGISMATKNIGYGAICNTNRLHKPLFFNVCTEVCAAPVIRDKMVLNVTDGLRAQYDGGPGPAAQFVYSYNSLFFATDPFALDRICHDLITENRRQEGVKVNDHPMFTEYLRYAEKLGLGIADPPKIDFQVVEA